MLALQVLAAILLVLSAACFFGPQLVIYGPRSFPAVFKQRQARIVGGILATACVFAVAAPHFASSVVQGGNQMSPAMLNMTALSFSA